jgi:dsRNA-specific ribonuclease
MANRFPFRPGKEKRDEEKRKLTDEKFSPLRGENFKGFIKNLLTMYSKIPEQKVLEYLEHIQLFEQAFTSSTFNSDWNYEALEILGDSICNYCVVQYLTERFPDLMNSNGSGVGTLSRLKINLVSKTIFAQCAEKLGFGDHIASNLLQRRDEMRNLLEDTFEAFQGALSILQKKCDPNGNRKGFVASVGPTYRIMSYYLNTIEISLKYDDLYDAKTRLKQLVESCKLKYPTFKVSQQINDDGKIVFTTVIYITGLQGEWGTGTGFFKDVSEQNACEKALANLKIAGYTR